MVTSIKNTTKKIYDRVFSTKSMRLILVFLILVSILSAVDYGMKNEIKSLWNSLNWVLWLSIVFFTTYRVEMLETRVDVQKAYIESLESYKNLTDDNIGNLKELFKAYKSRCQTLEDLVENYRNLSDLNEGIIKKKEAIIDQYKVIEDS